MGLSHLFQAVAFAFHTELLKCSLLAWRRLLNLDLVLTLGVGRLRGVA